MYYIILLFLIFTRFLCIGYTWDLLIKRTNDMRYLFIPIKFNIQISYNFIIFYYNINLTNNIMKTHIIYISTYEGYKFLLSNVQKQKHYSFHQ